MIDIELEKRMIKDWFDNFGYKQSEMKDNMIKWKFESDEFISEITIDRKYNALRLYQFNKKTGKQEPFGVMAPLFEVISLARDVYQISLNTRQFNKDWTESKIIKGTEGK